MPKGSFTTHITRSIFKPPKITPYFVTNRYHLCTDLSVLCICQSMGCLSYLHTWKQVKMTSSHFLVKKAAQVILLHHLKKYINNHTLKYFWIQIFNICLYVWLGSLSFLLLSNEIVITNKKQISPLLATNAKRYHGGSRRTMRQTFI